MLEVGCGAGFSAAYLAGYYGAYVANEPHPGNPLIRLARVIRKRLNPHYASDQQELSAADLQRLYRRAGLVDIRIVPQGLLSTPFAEVILQPQAIMPGLAALACAIDAGLEHRLGRRLQPFTWNVIAAGRKPQ
jgi:hypothetical protein